MRSPPESSSPESGEFNQNAARDIVFITKFTRVSIMLRYIAGLVGAVAAMIAFRLLGMFDFSLRILIFFAVYLAVTIFVDKALARYGKKES
jgi:multidrug efflux pump subunit AcrB